MSGLDLKMIGKKVSKLINSIILMALFQQQVFAEEVDLELLEFLGEWEADEGEWVEPERFEEEEGEEKEYEKTTE